MTSRATRAAQCAAALIAACCLLGCADAQPDGGTITRVQRVVSGHTLEVLLPERQPALRARIRLIGIEAPDGRQQPWGPAARARLSKLVGGKRGERQVRLSADVTERDRFGRRLAYVWKAGTLLNQRLVEHGHALAIERAPNTRYSERLAHAQAYARILGRGIWDTAQPLRKRPGAKRARER
ncbi:MAG: nuclease [Cyanobacteria bacterium QS_8_64_29]|nr:MAG: nuclease [Cyanobacteria bacterium QS_8_64_29]